MMSLSKNSLWSKGLKMFKDFSSLRSGGHFVHKEKCLGNFGRGPYEEHLHEIILNLGLWITRGCYF